MYLMKFQELTDEKWELITPSLPPPAYTGRPRANDRSIVNGILFVLLTGCRWMDMPSKYGSHKTAWERHKKWSMKGVWKGIMGSLVSRGYSHRSVDMEDLSIDSSTVEAKKGGSL